MKAWIWEEDTRLAKKRDNSEKKYTCMILEWVDWEGTALALIGWFE